MSRQRKKKGVEFSKVILLLVMAVYFITVGVGIWLSLVDYSQFSTLAMLVGAPTATALGFYAWKAKAENIIKIKRKIRRKQRDRISIPQIFYSRKEHTE